jgi:triosephosphate isomerase
VSAGNISSFMALPNVDGALVGGASLEPKSFAMIVRF